MAGRMRGWFRSSGNNEWIQQARTRLAQAFLDMDHRQSAAEAAVGAAGQMFPGQDHSRAWEPVRARCYAAADAYLSWSQELEAAERDNTWLPAGQARTDAVVAQLADAAAGIDAFYQQRRATLEEAVQLARVVPQLVARVRAEAAEVRGRVLASEYAGYPSVRQRTAALDEVLLTLDALDPATEAGRVRQTANRVQAITEELSEALSQAPFRGTAATNAVSSASTRLDAVRTRAQGLRPAYSALLREFNAASSADLTNNERESQRAIDAAAEALTRARTALRENDPETALELTSIARGDLAEAEQLIDSVTARLAMLRSVREDPEKKLKDVRFRLRDAQMLAVSRDLVSEWGSVLDAQAERLDRISATLSGRHPDYWAYVTELDAVTEFIAGVVERMRKQPGPPR
ncbi:MAG TPA: hypothetical protein VK083_04085 [Nocardia sp.]|uniref:hypothetical protein n=1 Tax=Nocardia TaxID=1817 RepID=UPI0024548658|nr:MULTISPECIES: hypothetical protein [Nocardia]HLS75958.1 hypothetical protein [Nocardia sp.]